jgi:regulator of protease activity HflC (stomatin/prohibitin superfamily)
MFSLSACGSPCGKVPAGNVGLVVNTLGSDKGAIEVKPIGRYWLGPNEDLYLFPTFKQTVTWQKEGKNGKGEDVDESISFQADGGLKINADFGITFTISPDKVEHLFITYRRGIDEIADTYLRNYVRDAIGLAASTMPVEAIYGSGKAKLVEDVTSVIREKVAKDGILIEDIFIIGDMRLPPAVIEAINSKSTATQSAMRAENELRTSEAEAKKNVAAARGRAEALLVEAEAQAKANQLMSQSLTQQLVDLEKIKRETEVQKQWIEKWGGVTPQTVTGDGNAMVTLPR